MRVRRSPEPRVSGRARCARPGEWSIPIGDGSVEEGAEDAFLIALHHAHGTGALVSAHHRSSRRELEYIR